MKSPLLGEGDDDSMDVTTSTPHHEVPQLQPADSMEEDEEDDEDEDEMGGNDMNYVVPGRNVTWNKYMYMCEWP